MQSIDIKKITQQQLDFVNMRIKDLNQTLNGLILDKQRLENILQM
jgi:hypothetical protein